MATLIANTNLRGTLNEGININQGRDFSDSGNSNAYLSGNGFIDTPDDFSPSSLIGSSITIGKGRAWVKYIKPGIDTFTHYMKCELTTVFSGVLPISNGYIRIQINSSALTAGSSQIDGSDYFTIEYGSSLPISGYYLELFSIVSGTLTKSVKYRTQLNKDINLQSSDYNVYIARPILNIKGGTTSGTSTSYILSLPSLYQSYQDMDMINVRFDEVNASNPTININGLGSIGLYDSSGLALSSGKILTNKNYILLYNNTIPGFQIVGLSNGGSDIGIYFGDGSDGNVIISSNTTLTRDMQYNNLTINTGITLNTGGYFIFVKGILINNGTISRNGNDGGNGSTGGAGIGGAALFSKVGNVFGGGNGNSPYSGYLTVGTNPTPLSSTDTFFNGLGVIGGNGGSIPIIPWSGGVAVGANNSTSLMAFEKLKNRIYLLLVGEKPPVDRDGLCSSGGGAGGAGGSNGIVSGGGGGGGNGGNIAIYANILNISATGIIESRGGAGGNAGNSTSSTNNAFVNAGSGGGGGGNGGNIFIITDTLSNLGVIRSIGGNGGNGGNASSAIGTNAAGGGGGGNGGGGGYIFYHAFTILLGTLQSTGGSGGTGGLGVNGGVIGSTGAIGGIGLFTNLL